MTRVPEGIFPDQQKHGTGGKNNSGVRSLQQMSSPWSDTPELARGYLIAISRFSLFWCLRLARRAWRFLLRLRSAGLLLRGYWRGWRRLSAACLINVLED